MDQNVSYPLVSIIMPAFNAEAYILPTIQSVIAQTYPHWELIIINDGSTDGTQKLVEQWVEQDSRIKLINQPNKRAGSARNTGMKEANGTWIAYLDADDLWTPNKLELQVNEVRRQNADLIFTDGWIVYDDDFSKPVPYKTLAGQYTGQQMYQLLMEDNYVPILAVLINKQVVDAVGDQDEINLCEDWDYWIRVARAGYTFVGITEKTFYYRRHQNNTSTNKNRMVLGRMMVLKNNFDVNHLSAKQSNEIFIQLAIIMLQHHLVKETKQLLSEVKHKLGLVMHVSHRLVSSFSEKAVLPLRILNKLNKTLVK